MKIKNIGIPSLMMVFLTLALMVFAALSLSIASADKKYSEKNADHKKAYYEASSKSEVLLNEIDGILIEAYTDSQSATNYFSKAASTVENHLGQTAYAFKVSHKDDRGSSNPTVSWQVPIDDNNSLTVEIAITSPNDNPDGTFYRILAWQVEPSILY